MPPSPTGYLRSPDVAARLAAAIAAHPDLATPGTGWVPGHNGAKSNYLKIRPATPTSAPRWRVLLLGGVHARELAPPDALLSFVDKLLAAYTTGADVAYPAFTAPDGTVFDAFTVPATEARAVIDRLDLYVAPLVNPDGRDFVLADVTTVAPDVRRLHRNWRKNRRPAPAGDTAPEAVGVDINRNFDILWDFNKHYDVAIADVHTSDDPRSEIFAGPPPGASEPETSNVAGLMGDADINYLLDVHAFSRTVMYSWGIEANQSVDASMNFANPAWDHKRDGTLHDNYREYIPTAVEAEAKALADRMAALILARAGGTNPLAQGRSQYASQPSSKLYVTSGSSDDYAFSRWFTAAKSGRPIRRVLAFTMEAGGDPRAPADANDDDGVFQPNHRTQYPKIEREIHAAVWAFLTGIAATPVQSPSAPALPARPSAPPTPPPPPPPDNSRCLVATTAYADPDHPSVVFLRDVRDRQVPATGVGRRFGARLNTTYRAVSPPIAGWLSRHPRAVTVVRRCGLDPMVRGLRALSDGTADRPRVRSLLLGAVLGGTVWPALLLARGVQRTATAIRSVTGRGRTRPTR